MRLSIIVLLLAITTGVFAQNTVTEPKEIITAPQDIIVATYSPDGSMLAAGAWNKSVLIYSVDSTGVTLKYTLKKHTAAITGLSFSRDNKMLATVAEDKAVVVWNTETGTIKHVFTGHTGKITGVIIDPSMRFVITSSEDKTIRFWDMKPPPANPNAPKRSSNRILTVDYPVTCLALDVSGRMLYVGNGNNIEQLNIAGNLAKSFTGHTNTVTGIDRSLNKKYLATSSADRTIIIWDIQTGKAKHTLRGHSWDITSIQFSIDSKYLVSSSKDGKVILWDVETGKIITTYKKQGAMVVTCATISADEKTIAAGTTMSGSPGYVIIFWNSGVERELPKMPAPRGGQRPPANRGK